MATPDYSLVTLSNGLQLAHKRVTGTRLVHCGFIIHTGSRNDGAHDGIAHCLEHMLFKGTKKRRTIHVLNHLEVVGGEMNAFTTKEITAIYASLRSTHYARAVDIITDVTFRSTIPENELVKEKKVITEEINMYLDTPEENIYDEMHEMVFENHPLAHNILGTVETLNKIERQDILAFTDAWYYPQNVVFVVVGNVSLARAAAALEKYTADIQFNNKAKKQVEKSSFIYNPKSIVKDTDFIQAYSILGIPAYDEANANRWKLSLLTNLLGGPGLNSRLNIAIREKYGFTYHIESGYQPYSDAGLFHCYLGSEKKYIQKSVSLVLKELKKIKEQKLGTLQMSRFKNQYLGQMVMAEENRSSLMVHLGKGILTEGYAKSLDEIVKEIEKITAEELLETANEILNLEQLSYLTYLPE